MGATANACNFPLDLSVSGRSEWRVGRWGRQGI